MSTQQVVKALKVKGGVFKQPVNGNGNFQYLSEISGVIYLGGTYRQTEISWQIISLSH